MINVIESLDIVRAGSHQGDGGSVAAVPDGATNNRARLQTLIDNIASSGRKGERLYFPPGRYMIEGTLTIPVAAKGLTIEGAGKSTQGTELRQATGDGSPLITSDGGGTLAGLTIENCMFSGVPGAGDMIDLVDLVSDLKVLNCSASLPDTSSYFFKIDGFENHHVLIEGCQIICAPGATVMPIKIASPVDADTMTHGTIRRCSINCNATMTAPAIEVRSQGLTTCPAFMFEDLLIEEPYGGAIHVYGLTAPIFQRVATYDISGPVTAPLILCGTDRALQSMMAPTLIGCYLVGGDTNNPDVVFDELGGGGNPRHCLLISNEIGWLDTRNSSVTIIGGKTNNIQGAVRPLRVSHNVISGTTGIWGSNTDDMVARPLNFGGETWLESAATATVTFDEEEADARYDIKLSANKAENFYVTGKTTTGFTINSDNASSVARVHWELTRSATALWVPGDEASLILDLDASQGVAVSGSDVTGWTDQSAEVNTFGATGGADNPPELQADGWAPGIDQVLFDASNTESLARVGFTHQALNDYMMVAAVDLQTAAAVTQYLLGANGVGLKAHHGSAGPGVYDGSNHIGAGTGQTGKQIITLVLNAAGTSLRVYRDGELLGTDSYDGTFSLAGTCYLGRFSTAVQYLDAAVARLLVFNTFDLDIAKRAHSYMVDTYM